MGQRRTPIEIYVSSDTSHVPEIGCIAVGIGSVDNLPCVVFQIEK